MANQQLSSNPSFVSRTLDAVDRTHARATTVIHSVRNNLRSTLESGIDRLEQLTTSALDRARKGVQRADTVSADAVNRAQGVVGHVIERARMTRDKREQLVS